MKKIILTSLFILMFVFSSLSVYAYTVYADVEWNDDLQPYINGLTMEITFSENFYVKGNTSREYSSMMFHYNNSSYELLYKYKSGLYYYNDRAYVDGAWTDEKYKHIEFINEISDELKELLDGYSTVTYYDVGTEVLPPVVVNTCDGSSCQVRDFNVDEICDTCGYALAYNVQRTYTPNGWGAYPLPPLGYGADSKYIILQDAVGDKWLYALTPTESGETWYTSSYGDTTQRIWYANENGSKVYLTFRSYLLDDINNEWEQKVSNTLTELNFSRVEAVVYYSSLELYNEDGTLFFPQPLWMEVQKGFTLTQLMNHLMGTMGQLTIVGIGLIALLIGLILLVKVLRKSVTK